MDYEYQLRRTRTADTDPAEAGIVHRLYLPAPADLDRVARHRHHITTRNVFAVLCRASLVGVTLGQTLLDVAERLDHYLASTPQPQPQPPFDANAPPPLLPPSLLLHPPFATADAPAPHPAQQLSFDGGPRAVRLLLDYIDERELADVRGWAEGAASMLVWTERAAKHAVAPADVPRLEALWREGFVHGTGLLGALQTLPEWRTISPITKALVDRASLEVQVRVTAADRRLAGFHFHDVWPVSSAGPPAARLAFDRFHRFLLEHYAARFGAWPPGDGDGDAHARVTRPLCQLLQRDFAALYWYLVDTDAVWSPAPTAGSTATTTTITTITTTSSSSSNSSSSTAVTGCVRRTIVRPSQPAWRPDDESLPMTEMLRSFDERENHPPIPHPFPLVPPPTPASVSIILASSAIGSAGVGGLGTSKKPKGFFPSAGQRSRAAQAAQAAAAAAAAGNPAQAANSPAATALALSESTNIEALRSSTSLNPLLEAFQAHEKSVPGHDIAPRDARKGRWIMIYAVVQTLASVAPDAPGLRWCDGVEYWLNPKLRGTPPWKPASPADDAVDERSHFRSPFWLGSGSPAPTPGEFSAPPNGPAAAPVAPAVTLATGQQQHQQQQLHQHLHQHQHQRLRARSRSRSRRQLRALHRESREHRGLVPATAAATTPAAAATAADSHAQRRAESSGDEGDDEMDAGESPSPSPSSPPQPQPALLATWGQRHVRADGLNLGVVRNDEAPWEM